jgi:hypothetical protein
MSTIGPTSPLGCFFEFMLRIVTPLSYAGVPPRSQISSPSPICSEFLLHIALNVWSWFGTLSLWCLVNAHFTLRWDESWVTFQLISIEASQAVTFEIMLHIAPNVPDNSGTMRNFLAIKVNIQPGSFPPNFSSCSCRGHTYNDECNNCQTVEPQIEYHQSSGREKLIGCSKLRMF